MTKVLVVDDDLVWLSIAQAWLKLAGYEVIARASAPGTLAVIETQRPDFVLLDINMPGMNGEILAKLIVSKDHEDAPGVMLYSSDDAEETRERARRAGALGAISKSSDRKQFIAELQACFAARLPKVMKSQ